MITNDRIVNVDISNLESGASWQYNLKDSDWVTGIEQSFSLDSDTEYAVGDIKIRQIDVAGNPGIEVGNTTTITIDNNSSTISLPLSLIDMPQEIIVKEDVEKPNP